MGDEHLGPTDLAIVGLASFRFTRLVVLDDLPPVKRARGAVLRFLGPKSAWAEGLSCPWCVGAWLSLGTVLAYRRSRLARVLAFAAAASAITGLVSTLDSYLSPSDATPIEWHRAEDVPSGSVRPLRQPS